MLQNCVLSTAIKNVLLSLQEMQKEYPTWLEKNGESLTSEQRSMYEAQQAHVDAVCRHLEEHGDSKFERLQELLQEVRACGRTLEPRIAKCCLCSQRTRTMRVRSRFD